MGVEQFLSYVALLFSFTFPLVIVALIPIIFAPASGWTKLARMFPARDNGPPFKVIFGFATFHGWIGFNGCMKVGSDEYGIAVGTNFLLPIGFRTMFIPWTAVEAIVRKRSSFGIVLYQIRIKGAPEVDFALRGAAFAAIFEDAAAARVPLHN